MYFSAFTSAKPKDPFIFSKCLFISITVTDLSEAMSLSTSPDSSKEEDDFPPPPAELLHPESNGKCCYAQV